MKLSEIISKNNIIVQLDAKSKQQVLKELARALADQEDDLDPAHVTRVLEERERIQSTAIDQGIAIPHGKSAFVSRLLACLGRSVTGVDFDSTDGQPTHLFFGLMAPENSRGEHLKALARVSRLLGDPYYRKVLVEAKDAEAMLGVIHMFEESQES